MGDEVLVPFQLFSSEMANADIQIQTQAMMRIEYILALMTPEQVRDEMVGVGVCERGELESPWGVEPDCTQLA